MPLSLGSRPCTHMTSAVHACDVQATSDPWDPLLQQLRVSGSLMPHRMCSGAAIPADVVDLNTTIAPQWSAEDGPGLWASLRSASVHSQSTGGPLLGGEVRTAGAICSPAAAAMLLPASVAFNVCCCLLQVLLPSVHLAANAMLDTTATNSSIPLTYSTLLLLTGPFNDAPELAVTAVLDLANRSSLLSVNGKGQVLVSKLVGGLACMTAQGSTVAAGALHISRSVPVCSADAGWLGTAAPA